MYVLLKKKGVKDDCLLSISYACVYSLYSRHVTRLKRKRQSHKSNNRALSSTFFFAFFLSCSIGNTILTDSRYAIGTTIDQRDYSSPILCLYTPNGVRVYTYINESGDSNNEQLII
jgi:hypothetical protein